ncbi:hypothetical protein [Vibrio mediterranei]|uniref:hypothetical protein n=1 Tax=Vibrio mediterranei TaxID=689 RepID=UPI0040696A3C
MSAHKIPVYPSQLDDFKSEAKHIASRIVYVHREQPLLSAFKRNDALAKAFGYAGHADLTVCSRSLTEPKDLDKYSMLVWRKQWNEQTIAERFAEHLTLSAAQVFDALNKPVPKQTQFEVIDGTPIVQFSPLDNDISNELRSDEELEKWWNVPFVLEDYDGVRSNWTVYCLNGGAWDRATGKVYGSKSREEAIVAARNLKTKNPNYRDYGVKDDGITHIKVDAVQSELDAFNAIIRESSIKQTYAGEVKNALENVVIDFVEDDHNLDLQLLLALLCNATIDGNLLGTEANPTPFSNADFMMDGSNETRLCFSISNHYLAQFIAACKPPKLIKHIDHDLPFSIAKLEDKLQSLGEMTSSVWSEAEDGTFVIKSYVIEGTDYYAS